MRRRSAIAGALHDPTRFRAGVLALAHDLDAVHDMWRERATYEPRISTDERESLLERWHEAVERSRGWARD